MEEALESKEVENKKLKDEIKNLKEALESKELENKKLKDENHELNTEVSLAKKEVSHLKHLSRSHRTDSERASVSGEAGVDIRADPQNNRLESGCEDVDSTDTVFQNEPFALTENVTVTEKTSAESICQLATENRQPQKKIKDQEEHICPFAADKRELQEKNEDLEKQIQQLKEQLNMAEEEIRHLRKTQRRGSERCCGEISSKYVEKE